MFSNFSIDFHCKYKDPVIDTLRKLLSDIKELSNTKSLKEIMKEFCIIYNTKARWEFVRCKVTLESVGTFQKNALCYTFL